MGIFCLLSENQSMRSTCQSESESRVCEISGWRPPKSKYDCIHFQSKYSVFVFGLHYKYEMKLCRQQNLGETATPACFYNPKNCKSIFQFQLWCSVKFIAIAMSKHEFHFNINVKLSNCSKPESIFLHYEKNILGVVLNTYVGVSSYNSLPHKPHKHGRIG